MSRMDPRSRLHGLRMQFRQRALAPDTLFLLSPADAIDLIERATADGLRLAGVEGFLITDAGAYEPRQDFSNDAENWQDAPQKFLEHTRGLLERGISLGIRFQIVFEDESA